MYIYDKQSDRIHRNKPKHSNLENHCFRYIRPQKSPKIAQKTDNSIAFYSDYLIGMVNFLLGDSSCPNGSEYVWERGFYSLGLGQVILIHILNIGIYPYHHVVKKW